jgi:glycosyltransferase involved in cell wall biosynthesis
MRILVAHNHYQQVGGEDSVFANEVALLSGAGHTVDTLEVDNDRIGNDLPRYRVAAGATYSLRGRSLAAKAIARFKPDIVHVHNPFPLLSPSVFHACARAGVPAVWTMHNFRIACAQGLLFREGEHCVLCVGKPPLPAIFHRCYRGSFAGSAAVAAMIATHRLIGTWRRHVARFIVLNEYGRDVAIRSGAPPERIVIKPNFSEELSGEDQPPSSRSGALYVGRLSPEKGTRTLMEAWQSLPDIPLTILGDGPERVEMENMAPPNVRFLGHRPKEDVMREMIRTRALILPSTCFENFSVSLCEAMAAGTPAIASRSGSIGEVVRHGYNGLLVPPGNAGDLAATVADAFAHPCTLEQLGQGARETWEHRLSPKANLAQLLTIYEEAMSA